MNTKIRNEILNERIDLIKARLSTLAKFMFN